MTNWTTKHWNSQPVDLSFAYISYWSINRLRGWAHGRLFISSCLWLPAGWKGGDDAARCQVSSEEKVRWRIWAWSLLLSPCQRSWKSDASCLSSQMSCKRASKESCHMHELGEHWTSAFANNLFLISLISTVWQIICETHKIRSSYPSLPPLTGAPTSTSTSTSK